MSNFYPSEIIYEGITYPTVEHAYQAAKTTDVNTRRGIAEAATPAMAKRLGRAVKIREGWDAMKVNVMADLVALKIAYNPDLAQALANTGDAYLAETNLWGDKFWGVSRGEGENQLGQILMKERSKATFSALLQNVPATPVLPATAVKPQAPHPEVERRRCRARDERAPPVPLPLGSGEPRDVRHEVIRPAQPAQVAQPILELVRLRLESSLPGKVEAMESELIDMPLDREQTRLFTQTSRRNLDAANRALARLRAALGVAAVARARVCEGHLPEAAFLWEPLEQLEADHGADGTADRRERSGAPLLVRRILERPADLAKLTDPELFFRQHRERLVVLDEVQRGPDLFPILRVLVDEGARNAHERGGAGRVVKGRWDRQVAELLSAELVQWRHDRLQPTRRGMLMADMVAAEFL